MICFGQKVPRYKGLLQTTDLDWGHCEEQSAPQHVLCLRFDAWLRRVCCGCLEALKASSPAPSSQADGGVSLDREAKPSMCLCGQSNGPEKQTRLPGFHIKP